MSPAATTEPGIAVIPGSDHRSQTVALDGRRVRSPWRRQWLDTQFPTVFRARSTCSFFGRCSPSRSTARPISERIQQISEDVLQINRDHCIQPFIVEHQGWIEAKWVVSQLGRRAKYYRLTPSGRHQLAVEASE